MTQRIPQDVIDHMHTLFMGKKITFENMSGERFVGNCEFMGYNPNFPSWEFQVTVDRFPVTHVKVSTIELYKGRESMFGRQGK